jgi:hypothetical protein
LKNKLGEPKADIIIIIVWCEAMGQSWCATKSRRNDDSTELRATFPLRRTELLWARGGSMRW